MQLGNLVDFEAEGEDGRFLPRMRSLSHMGFSWLYEHNHLLIWHNFIHRLESHLRDAGEIEPFYFDLLMDAAKKWGKQNPKRVAVESYVKLLAFEGRLYTQQRCYICETPLQDKVSLMHAFKPAHPGCIFAPALSLEKIFDLFESKKTVFLEDSDIAHLFEITMKGF